VDGIQLKPDHVTSDMYVVGCRGDGHYPAICQTVIQHNTLRIAGEAAIYIPQWAQPALLPRDASRTGIRNVGFFGHAAVNLMKCFHQESFLKELGARGYELLIRDRGEQVSWSDYRDIDVVLSVRNIPYKHLRLKPANKLLNAWLAGTPAIMGPEPAIQALSTSDLDYLEVRDAQGVFKALELLEARPSLYEAMVMHGRKRAVHYSDDAVAGRWDGALTAIRADFQRWQQMSRSQWERDYLRRARNLRMALGKHDRDIHRAYREMGFEREWWAQTRPPNI
jgi:hypothetical protein